MERTALPTALYCAYHHRYRCEVILVWARAIVRHTAFAIRETGRYKLNYSHALALSNSASPRMLTGEELATVRVGNDALATLF